MDNLTQDLILPEKAKSELTPKEIVELINDSLKNKWTVTELSEGKEIELFPEWLKIIEKIIWAYKMKGWEVFHCNNGKRKYLSFTNPKKRTLKIKYK